MEMEVKELQNKLRELTEKVNDGTLLNVVWNRSESLVDGKVVIGIHLEFKKG